MSDIKNNDEFKAVDVTNLGKTEEEIKANPEFAKIIEEYFKKGYSYIKLETFNFGTIISSQTFPKRKPADINLKFHRILFEKSITKNDPKLK